MLQQMRRRMVAAAWLAALASTACGTTMRQTLQGGVGSGAAGSGPRTPAEQAKADGGVMPYTRADVEFMQGMIGHHAQAVVMAGWAPAHGARSDVRTLAGRIDVAQRDEIAFMQRWLRDRHELAPDASAQHEMDGHQMSGMKMMPGMLTPAQMAQLSAATGTEFDRLFLTYMIQHHQGAIAMVEALYASQGSGQDLYIFRFASDVNADQATEIDRMRTMLPAPPL